MHYLAIAAKKELLPYLPIDWPKTELTELVNPASLAAVVIDEKDSRSRGIYQTMKEKLGLDLPLIEFTPETSPAEISRLAQTYEEANVPRFIRELTAFSDQDDLVFDTPGHHNGRFYDRHPAGAVLRNFFGDNYFRADTSDCVSELGDMMNHTGGPLEAQQEAAKAFNADKVYFCTNGTTSANANAKANAELGEHHRGLNATQRELAAKLANDIRTDKRVGLLKKRTKKDGNAQRQQLLPNDTLRYIDSRRFLSHTPSPPTYVKQQNGNLRPKQIPA